MKRIILSLIAVLLLSAPAYSGIVLTLKNGNTLKWQNYTEENNQYCTIKDYGKMCISKNTVVSVKETGKKEKEEVVEKTVIVMPSPSEEIPGKEIAQRDAELKKWKEERDKQEKMEEAEKKETEEKERIIRIEEKKAEAAERSARAAEESADAAAKSARAAEELNNIINSRRRR